MADLEPVNPESVLKIDDLVIARSKGERFRVSSMDPLAVEWRDDESEEWRVVGVADPERLATTLSELVVRWENGDG